MAWSVPTGSAGGAHHRHGRHHLHQTRLGEALRHPIGRHVTHVVERGVPGVVFDHRHDHAPIIEVPPATA